METVSVMLPEIWLLSGLKILSQSKNKYRKMVINSIGVVDIKEKNIPV